MKACIVSVGNELLNGQTVDTNASWLSGKLFELGIPTVGTWLVPDQHNRVVGALHETTRQGDLILVTGGLGPTDDDITRVAVAEFLGRKLEFHQQLLDEMKSFFQKRGKTMASKNRSQAYIPESCQALSNPKGTAPGFWGTCGDAHIAVMPGVPSEMRFMFMNQVTPRISEIHSGSVVISGKLRCFGIGESDVAEKLGALMDRTRNPLINCTCGAGDILLNIVAMAPDSEEAQKMIDNDKRALMEILGEWAYGEDGKDLPNIVLDLLKKNGKTIAFAESCTGGLLSKMLTDIPGSSECFLSGWVTYSNEAKVSQLDIPSELIDKFGAVSEPVARIMAENAARKAGSDIAVSTTGIAGPAGSSPEKPIGLVYIGVVVDGVCKVYQCRFPPTGRDWVRLRAALSGLNHVRLRLQV